MPNIKQIFDLKKTYGGQREGLQELNEASDYIEKAEVRDSLVKALNIERASGQINETRLFSFLQESLNLNPNKPEILRYFDEGKEEDVALLFIDITSFSRTITGWTNKKIKDFLDDYYKQAIPIIYKHGGEIEKLMGDGIICVFGKPFLDLSNPAYVYRAETCAHELIKTFYKTQKAVKVAINKGAVHYYKVPGDEYGEYTIIGQPITELYRLESISKENAINFFARSSYDRLGFTNCVFDETDVIGDTENITPLLQGVSYTQMRYMRFPGYL